MKCRHCGAAVTLPFVDLGSAPPSNAYVTEDALSAPETWYPLRVSVCTDCWLVQTEDFARPADLFSRDYAYFSSFSSTWLDHVRRYVADVSGRFALGGRSQVVEIASNDGYLLQYFVARGIPCLGVEPAAGTARAARERGIGVVEEFFDRSLAERLVTDGMAADLIIANNVLAHVPNIDEFVAGFPVLLKEDGVATFEFPHLLELVKNAQIDTIYHEHFSYLSLVAVQRIFERNGLSIFDVDRLPTHGGSLRVYAQRRDAGSRPVTAAVTLLRDAEVSAGVLTREFYAGFQVKAERIKNDFLHFLIESCGSGLRVAAYGAAAKGNTLLNFAGVRPDLIHCVADRNPAKQGKYLPGSRIPIVAESELRRYAPQRVVILPWNLQSEIASQLRYIADWGGQFAVAIPSIRQWSS